MDIKSLLDQLLNAGSQQQQNQSYKGKSHSGVTDKLSSLVGGKGGAAMAGGALGLLLGSKSGRKMGKKALTYGGLAIFGTLAYKAYQNYQKQATQPTDNPVRPLAQLPSIDATNHCKAILIAIIAAAKADGHVDDNERRLIDEEVAKLTADPNLQRWFDLELKKPLDPAEVARNATSPAMAAEMYLASVFTVDQQNFMERAYLDELSKQLNIPPALQSELALQVQQAQKALPSL